MIIELLDRPGGEADVGALAALLVDAVEAGASVSFLPPLSMEVAARWWRRELAGAVENAAFFVARDEEGIAGTVQLHPSWAPNQPHRADVAKLMVHRRARRRGLGRALMDAAVAHARAAGLTLLTLDTRRGDAAEQLYRATGWTEAGAIPGYALGPDGTAFETVMFYKKV
jgi:GNAT superfamily N-acetyltransferase